MRPPASVSGILRHFIRDAGEGIVVFLTFSDYKLTLTMQRLGTSAFVQNAKGGSQSGEGQLRAAIIGA